VRWSDARDKPMALPYLSSSQEVFCAGDVNGGTIGVRVNQLDRWDHCAALEAANAVDARQFKLRD
jgi:hypothetical protein